ncbi:hypothetical protein BKA65DRAFT_492717 [Rhexocercosporidium sp. MPI-PUGE-AT-0058]|nr:hypothetical protein BKA65DRAFT_492717 [Rhexocercosporidium sp. MPI-PUGE-AT-0058]
MFPQRILAVLSLAATSVSAIDLRFFNQIIALETTGSLATMPTQGFAVIPLTRTTPSALGFSPYQENSLLSADGGIRQVGVVVHSRQPLSVISEILSAWELRWIGSGDGSMLSY